MIATNGLLPAIPFTEPVSVPSATVAEVTKPTPPPTLAGLLDLIRDWSAAQTDLQRIEVHIRTHSKKTELALSFGLPPRDAMPALNGLREIEQNCLEAAPGPIGPPVTIKRLAKIAGYAYTSYLRGAVGHLLDMGLLIRAKHGVKLAPGVVPEAQPKDTNHDAA